MPEMTTQKWTSLTSTRQDENQMSDILSFLVWGSSKNTYEVETIILEWITMCIVLKIIVNRIIHINFHILRIMLRLLLYVDIPGANAHFSIGGDFTDNC